MTPEDRSLAIRAQLDFVGERGSSEAHGMELRCGMGVEEIPVRNGRAYGVRLTCGQEIHAKRVASNLSAKVTFDNLVAREHLPDEFVEDIDGPQTRGMSFKPPCAINSLPRCKGLLQEKTGVEYPAYAHICPTLEFLECAFDEAKYGWYSSEPFLPPIMPTCYDDTLAPEGKHVSSRSKAAYLHMVSETRHGRSKARGSSKT